jgi:hypothetical protein
MTHDERMAVRTSKAWLAGFPELVAQWHPTRNVGVYPYEISRGSRRFIWWRCAQGHSWKAIVGNRTKARGTGCPYCSGRLVSNANRLSRTHPKIAREWHPTRNGALTPASVSYGSSRQVWWQCAAVRSHAWKAPPNNRTNVGAGCPFCAGQQVHATNCLARRFPRVAAEWHPTKNGSLTPADVLGTTQRKVWWRCARNVEHEWQARVEDRTRVGSGCPHCFNVARRTGTLYAGRSHAPLGSPRGRPPLRWSAGPVAVTLSKKA